MSATTVVPRGPPQAHTKKCLQPLWSQEGLKRPIRGNVCNHFGPKKATRGPYEEMSATTVVSRRPQEAHARKCLQPLWAQQGHKRPLRGNVCNHFGPKKASRCPYEESLQPLWAQEGHKAPLPRNVCNHCGPKKATRGPYEEMSATTLGTRRPQEAPTKKCLQPLWSQEGLKKPMWSHRKLL